MGNDSDLRRRKLGLLCLATPVIMVILGQTALKASLDGVAFLVYWFLCFLFTFVAVFIALLDLRSVRRQTREEAEALLEQTLREAEAKQRPRSDLDRR